MEIAARRLVKSQDDAFTFRTVVSVPTLDREDVSTKILRNAGNSVPTRPASRP